MVAQQELIMVCADNSIHEEHFASQLDAIHVYCHAKLKSNPKTVVGIFTMARGSPNPFGCLLRPSTDLDEIMVHAQSIARGGELDSTSGFLHSTLFINSDHPNVQKRLLIFARGPTDMRYDYAIKFGNSFKDKGIAVDLVNFCLEKEHALKRRALNTFVDFVKNNENSRIKHLVAGYSIRDLLSSTPPIITPEEIAAAAHLKMPPRFPCKTKFKSMMDPNLFFKELKEKKSQAVADDDHVNAGEIKYGKRAPLGLVNKFEALSQENEEMDSADVGVQRWNNKDHQLIINSDLKKTDKNQKRAKENVNLIQELEPCRVAKKNQATAQMEYGKHVPQEILNKLEALTLENEKLKLENEKLKLELKVRGRGLAVNKKL